MKIRPDETALEGLGFPLPLYESIVMGEAEHENGTRFLIHAGLSREHAEELKALSLDESDEAIQTLTSDRKRFGIGSYEAWYEKGRAPFALIDAETDTLAALVWLGPSPLHDEPGDWHTIAYRSYPPFRGAGIMKSFAQFALDTYRKQYPDARFWAGIDAKNASSTGLAKALGFEKNEEHSDENHSVMIMKETS